MKIINIEPVEYGGRLKKTATTVGVQIIADNLVDNLSTLVTVFSEEKEVLETFNESLYGEEYNNLDTISGIDVNEEIARAILKKIGFKKAEFKKDDNNKEKQ